MINRMGNRASTGELEQEITELRQKLAKKSEDLSRARFRLRKAKADNARLKEIVVYQRNRILELH
jgi:hypothetical protein